MKKIVLFVTIILTTFSVYSQSNNFDKTKVRKDFSQIIQNIKSSYVYLDDKMLDMNCVEERYSTKIDLLNNQADVILFFEYLLNEFYDSHISLSTNIRESYRLSSPIYIDLSSKNLYFFIAFKNNPFPGFLSIWFDVK